jgi:hypothetical protein
MGTEIRRVLRLARMLDLPHSVTAKTYCVQGAMRNTVSTETPADSVPFISLHQPWVSQHRQIQT